MTQEQKQRLVQLLTSKFNVDELNEVTELLMLERDMYCERMKNNADIAVVRRSLPMKARHKLFGDVDIVGIRTECSSNNNLMYMLKNDGEYFWVYDYETEIIGNEA